MFIRQYFKQEDGQRTAYWALVESYRAAIGPRQRVVAWLGKLDEAGRLGVLRAAEESKRSAVSDKQDGRQPLNHQLQFEFDDEPVTQPRWVEVNAAGVRVENLRQFGGPWMALHLIRTLQLDSLLQNVMEEGKEMVPWDVTSLILITSHGCWSLRVNSTSPSNGIQRHRCRICSVSAKTMSMIIGSIDVLTSCCRTRKHSRFI